MAQPTGGDREGAHAELVQAVQGGLTPDLIRHDKCEPTGKSPQECHCYHAAEAVYHLAGAKRSGLVPVSGKLRKVTHWWLEDRKSGEIVDPTADQLPKRYDYTQGTRRGFLTLQPSKRAQVVIDRAKENLVRHDDGTVLALGAAGAAGFIGLTLAQAIRRRAGSRKPASRRVGRGDVHRAPQDAPPARGHRAVHLDDG